MYGILFPNLSSIISEKCMVTPNFLFGSAYSHTLCKNTFVFVGAVLKKPEFLWPSQDAQNLHVE